MSPDGGPAGAQGRGTGSGPGKAAHGLGTAYGGPGEASFPLSPALAPFSGHPHHGHSQATHVQACPAVSISLQLHGCSPANSSVHGISQARVLEWVATSFSGGIVSTQGLNLHLRPLAIIGRRFFTAEPPGQRAQF